MRKIEVRTSPNGYELSFDGMAQKTGYFFFTAERLIQAMSKLICKKSRTAIATANSRTAKEHEELKKYRRAYNGICRLYVLEREQRIAMSARLLEIVDRYPLDDETIKTLRQWCVIPRLTIEELKLK